ncbi:Voltage-gated potassium channel beta-2 subunit [Lasiodiplodia theobromae]|uniref:Voltage-gated potassium channel beta-2 subunit n=1 Tax=Lasiodiplodia theobromae TaxID=45133 RepID=UPI0015C3B462|nr:Voltage-gated potassium channel beta-2 subunit [Lasiodiplodia theobromae]KAF4539384.1 Voltage-gated potassium channel beta-2 subunit [Lasiodiplodia theobromae]
MKEPAFSPSKRRTAQEQKKEKKEKKKKHKWTWRNLGRFWERRREDGSKKLLAATLGPLANVLSIAALVTYWRMDLVVDGNVLPELSGVPFKDPEWTYWLNVASLICGFVGNFFLLMNFTQKVRYIIALPLTIILWYIATGLLTAILICMEIYVPPDRPNQTYTQGYWYAVMAAVFYCICSMILMVNMVGYWRGHYPQTFTLTESQRTLILQTMMFFVWLAGGGGIFSRIETLHGQDNWTFANALYFCDVTILTVGFGDMVPSNDVSRGLVFPYSVGGIIMLGLVVSSIYKFSTDLGHEKVVRKHIDKVRSRTLDRTVTSSFELRQRATAKRLRHSSSRPLPVISGPFNPVDRSAATRIPTSAKRREGEREQYELDETQQQQQLRVRKKKKKKGPASAVVSTVKHQYHHHHRRRQPRLLLLREEKDRFDTMRAIQHSTARFKRWYALTLSVLAFGILWCVGAVVFWVAERRAQGLSYFQALYFCYVSLLTVGYGDLAPKSNAGRSFFVVWSLIAVPTMTILISDMGDTVISGFKNATSKLADVTVLPKDGIWHDFLQSHPRLLNFLQQAAARRRIRRGLPLGPSADAKGEQEGEEEEGSRRSSPPSRSGDLESTDPDPDYNDDHDNDDDDTEDAAARTTRPPTVASLAAEDPETESDARLARRLAKAIRDVANDFKADVDRVRPKRYSYEEWVEFTKLIRFTAEGREEEEREEEEEGLVEWDWIGENSPMMAGMSEAEFVLDRLCESLGRYLRRNDGLGGEREVRRSGDEEEVKDAGG